MVFLKSPPSDDNVSHVCINTNNIITIYLEPLDNDRYKIMVVTKPSTIGVNFAEYGKEGPEIYQELIRRLELNPTESIQLPREDNIYQINKFLRKDVRI